MKNYSICGEVPIPGDKSISHRVLIISSMGMGTCYIRNISICDDVLRTYEALKILGFNLSQKDDLIISKGKNNRDFSQKKYKIYLGNSGTSARLLIGLISSFNGIECEIDGDDSLRSRPMGRVYSLLNDLQANIVGKDDNNLPCKIYGQDLVAKKNIITVPSAQVKSSIMLAALNTSGKSYIEEKTHTRDHTEKMLEFYGASIQKYKNGYFIDGKQVYSSKNYIVPSDPSSAIFFVVLALCLPNSRIMIRNILLNKYRVAAYQVLKKMGGNLSFINVRQQQNETIGDICASSSDLQGVVIDPDYAPSMIDEYPIISVAASFAKGRTIMKGLRELKYKESNRINSIIEGLLANNINAFCEEDNIVIHGTDGEIIGGSNIKSYGDHRIIMAFTVMSYISKNRISIDSTDAVKTSFPEFFSLIKQYVKEATN